MNFEIKNTEGHYALYVNGQFYQNYVTFNDAVKDIEEIKARKEVVA